MLFAPPALQRMLKVAGSLQRSSRVLDPLPPQGGDAYAEGVLDDADRAVMTMLLVWLMLALLLLGCALWGVRATSAARQDRELAKVDPFQVLELESRLASAAERVRHVDSDPTMMARAHHLRAALWAYDALLRDACALAGADVAPDDQSQRLDVSALQRALSAQDLPGHLSEMSTQALGDPDARFRRELELGARGWSW